MSGRPKFRVLVVDDDPSIRELVRYALEDDGLDVREAVNGAEALDVLASWRADVVLLDLMMPRMDGWDFREAQLADPRFREAPVVVLSAMTEHRRVVHADAFLRKPVTIESLLSTIERVGTTPPSGPNFAASA